MSDLRLTKPMLSGPNVRAEQRLTACGFDTGGTDGVFGRQTDAAVRALQKSKKLAVAVNGGTSGLDRFSHRVQGLEAAAH